MNDAFDGNITADKIDVTTRTGTETIEWPMAARQHTIAANPALRATRMTFGNVISIDLATGAIERLPGFTTIDEAALEFWRVVDTLGRTNPRTTPAE